MNKLLSKARNSAKPGKCILCGEDKTSFCNSYSVPQLALKNIAEKNVRGGYQILYWSVLPYKVPIAIQSTIALAKDLEGNEVSTYTNGRNSKLLRWRLDGGVKN